MGLFRSPSQGHGGWLNWISVAVPLLWGGAIVLRYLQDAPWMEGGSVVTVAAGTLLSVVGPLTDDRRLKAISIVGALTMLAVWGLITA